jgi:hypothetical protein
MMSVDREKTLASCLFIVGLGIWLGVLTWVVIFAAFILGK